MTVVQNEERPDRTFRTPTVRIDTLRNLIDGTHELLTIAAAELEDLHVLAYERQVTARAERVKGGDPDYALDTHGDKRARNAYRGLGDAVCEVTDLLRDSAREARLILREGEDRLPQPRSIAMTDLAAAIEAQERRAKIGDGYSPHRALPQPDKDSALSESVKETDKLKRQVSRLQRFARWAWQHQDDHQELPHDMLLVLEELFPARHSA